MTEEIGQKANDNDNDDIAARLGMGLAIDLHAAMRAEQAAREKADNEARKLQLLIARIEKAIGKRVDQKILISALVTLMAKTIMHSPRERHPQMVVNVGQILALILKSSYAAGNSGANGGEQVEVRLKEGTKIPTIQEQEASCSADPKSPKSPERSS